MKTYNFSEGPIECSDVSCQDFAGREFVDIDDGAYVYGSCFAQEKPDTVMFRADMRGVTFRQCNLSNVFIPEGNTLVGCQTISYEVQADGEDWKVDEQKNPVEPLDLARFVKEGKSLDPASLTKEVK